MVMKRKREFYFNEKYFDAGLQLQRKVQFHQRLLYACNVRAALAMISADACIVIILKSTLTYSRPAIPADAFT